MLYPLSYGGIKNIVAQSTSFVKPARVDRIAGRVSEPYLGSMSTISPSIALLLEISGGGGGGGGACADRGGSIIGGSRSACIIV